MKKNLLFKLVNHHPRLYVSMALGLIVAILGLELGFQSKLTAAIVGYDVGAIVYILWAFQLMLTSTAEQMQNRALSQDDGKVVVLCLVVLALLFSTSAIFTDLALAKSLEGAEKYERLALSLTTVVASWFFTNIVFALHYAHDYYFDLQSGKKGGLVFLPSDQEPHYLDFLYFSLVIGATAQTADVVLSSQKMRRSVSLQSILAFFFNTTLLALAVNMASGLI